MLGQRDPSRESSIHQHGLLQDLMATQPAPSWEPRSQIACLFFKFLSASLVVQLVKNLPEMQET